MGDVVYVAVVEHKYGTNTYAGETQESLYKQLAQFCRDWWDNLFSDEVETDADKEPPDDDFKCVEMYFNNIGYEYLITLETEPL